MHEIRVTLAPEHAAEAARLAHAKGIERVAISDVYLDGPNLGQKVVSVETSTPKARLFVEAVLASPVLSAAEYSVTSRELRAIVDRTDLAEVTKPMSEPFPDVIQDLWQLSHVSPSYVGRAAAGGILLATGIIGDSAISIVVAALFLPFLAEVLAVSFGLWSGDRGLIRRGAGALVLSAALAFLGGALVAWCAGGPIRFADFKSPLPSFAISAVIGITAGLSNADDTGRRYLIGVAAAVQLAVFPTWLGAATVIGLPARAILDERLLSFAINLATIAGTAVVAYAAVHLGDAPGWHAPRSGRGRHN